MTFNANWKPHILSAVDQLDKLISTYRRDPELNPGSLRWTRAYQRSATVVRSVFAGHCTVHVNIET